MTKQKKRNRFQLLTVEVGDKDKNPLSENIELNLELDLINGYFKAINSNTNQVIENKSIVFGYKGETKDRVTSEIETNPDDHSFCFKLKLKKYKHIIAIDTNSFSFYSEVLKEEVKWGLGFGILLVENGKTFDLKPILSPFITSPNYIKPENENWIKVIQLIMNTCKCSDSRKIGIVVDSDLGNIKDYNNRTKPLLGNYYLPENYELIFASDRAKDNIFNVMISKCHLLSKQLIPKFINHIKKVEQEQMKNK